MFLMEQSLLPKYSLPELCPVIRSQSILSLRLLEILNAEKTHIVTK